MALTNYNELTLDTYNTELFNLLKNVEGAEQLKGPRSNCFPTSGNHSPNSP